ncbi:nucleoside hydrolase [Terracidiphilus gabretensis]|uniref:nucleoside hydrolase n=1 Tax=Terracidiphilus gabretensis TaxID=1577687 RepID=UPI00071B9669|nr:nucleoside hydrolase [Terracidiphilus gabretensis]
MKTKIFAVLLLAAAAAASVSLCLAQGSASKRLVLIDQDGSGPGGSNQMAMLALLQAPNVQVLGITMVTGNAWRDEETLHTLRMLELTEHSDVPVAKGAVFPLVRSQEETRLSAALYGKETWLGAWGQGPTTLEEHGGAVTPVTSTDLKEHEPYVIPAMAEGRPVIKPIEEDAAHFLIRQVRAHPHQVTIYAAGPLTNIALAISIDPEFAALTQGLVVMGGSLNPQTDDPEFATSPRHEFNFWFDPEATHIVLRAAWPRVDVTTVDVSIKAPFTQEMLAEIAKSQSPTARYIAAWSQDRYYLWDELAACAWLDPSLITKETAVYMDIDLSHGPSYGDTLTWTEKLKPAPQVRLVHAQLDVDLPRFQKMFVELMKR